MGAEGYLRALLLNASVGMQTVVYDAAIWSDDAVVRAAAIEFWRPHLAHIRAWDMGDEFDPNTPEWDVLVARWRIVIDHVEPVTGVGPYTNNLPGHDVADAALAAMPEQARHFSFNDYTEGPMGEPVDVFAMVDHLGMRVGHLMCAVNALTHFQYVVTPAELELQTTMALDAGCDSILVFGGGQPYDTPGFDHASFVGRDGTSTPLASALHRALTKKY